MNERMNLDEWMKIVETGYISEIGGTVSGNHLYRPITFYFGKRVHYCKHNKGVILFEECEYCGNNTLDKYDCCTTCGAPVEI